MITLSKSMQGMIAIVALSAMSNVANASFFNSASDPFVNETVELKPNPAGLIPLPGVGPGGATLYANQFTIGNFAFVNYGATTVKGTSYSNVETLTADFSASFLNSDGTPAIIPAGFGYDHAGQQGAVLLTGGNFQVQFVGRSSPFATGTFTLNLLDATFHGQSNLTSGGAGGAMFVDLANVPSASVSIANHVGGGFDITYLTPFAVQGQYYNNDTGTGSPTVVPPLVDTNTATQQTVPESPAVALFAIGLLPLLASRLRRRTATAVAAA